MSTMKLPANYASISEEEMVYLDGGARDAYNSFLNVGKVFNAIARIFSGASSIINNVNVIYPVSYTHLYAHGQHPSKK